MKKITNIFFEGLENIFGLDSVWSFWLNRLVQQDPQICLGQPAYCATGEGFVAVAGAIDDRWQVIGNTRHFFLAKCEADQPEDNW